MTTDRPGDAAPRSDDVVAGQRSTNGSRRTAADVLRLDETQGHRAVVTVLIDNNSADEALRSEHGLALWIDYAESHVLFDTGAGSSFLENAEKLGVDLAAADSIVLSHGHYDHTGGLQAALQIAPDAKLYLHPDALRAKYSASRRPVRNIGMPRPAAKLVALRNQQTRVIWTDKPTQLHSGFFVTGPVPRYVDIDDTGGQFYLDPACRQTDPLIDDQAAFFTCPNGLVAVLGCAHSGVENCLDYIAEVTGRPRIHAVIGGMHLSNASPEKISRTIDSLRKYEVELIVTAHCTGSNASSQISKALGDRVVSAVVGRRIEL